MKKGSYSFPLSFEEFIVLPQTRENRGVKLVHKITCLRFIKLICCMNTRVVPPTERESSIISLSDLVSIGSMKDLKPSFYEK